MVAAMQASTQWALDTTLTGFAGIYVCVVGSGHYADRFFCFLCVCILSSYLGPYQRLARPDILSLHTSFLVLAV